MNEFLQRLFLANSSLGGRNMILYTSYYKDDARQHELDTCLFYNLTNPIFRRIIVFNEAGELPQNARNVQNAEIVHSVATTNRLTFSDFFRYANEIDQDDIHVLINSDIIIGSGFHTIQLEHNQAMCVSRRELHEDGSSSIEIGGGSHDAWIWRGKMKEDIGNFYMGKMLCDGVLANQLVEAGYKLKNPAKGLPIYHYHLSQVRHYGWHDAIRGRRRGINMTDHDHIFSELDLYEDGWN